MSNLKLIFSNLIFALLFLPLIVDAQAEDWGWFLDFGVNFSIFAQSLIVVIISLAFIFFLWGVATFILNSADDEKRAEGKKKMFWGIIALTVMLGVWGIVEFFLSAFGITETGVDLPTFPTNLP